MKSVALVPMPIASDFCRGSHPKGCGNENFFSTPPEQVNFMGILPRPKGDSYSTITILVVGVTPIFHRPIRAFKSLVSRITTLMN